MNFRSTNKEKFSYWPAINRTNDKRNLPASFGMEASCIMVRQWNSALAPKSIESNFPRKGIFNINFMALRAGIGYAYTLVIDKHFFVTLSQ